MNHGVIRVLCGTGKSNEGTESRRLNSFLLKSSLQFAGLKSSDVPGIADSIMEEAQSYTSKLGTHLVPRSEFQKIGVKVMERFGYKEKPRGVDFINAWEVATEQRGIMILLGGASGSGKSTLASLLSARLGINNVISTDSVRHVLRNYVDEEMSACLHASTYHAGESLLNEEAKARESGKPKNLPIRDFQPIATRSRDRRKRKHSCSKRSSNEPVKLFTDDFFGFSDLGHESSNTMVDDGYKGENDFANEPEEFGDTERCDSPWGGGEDIPRSDSPEYERSVKLRTKKHGEKATTRRRRKGNGLESSLSSEVSLSAPDRHTSYAKMSAKDLVLAGYQAQSAMVISWLDRVLSGCQARRESVIVEGVHLTTEYLREFMHRYPNLVPFVVKISSEAKHRERFVVRSKHMTLDPNKNKYVRFFENIRVIQKYLVEHAKKGKIPRIENTNYDRSVATIHMCVLGCIRRTGQGSNGDRKDVKIIDILYDEYRRGTRAMWSGKGALDAIRKQGVRAVPAFSTALLEDLGRLRSASDPGNYRLFRPLDDEGAAAAPPFPGVSPGPPHRVGVPHRDTREGDVISLDSRRANERRREGDAWHSDRGAPTVGRSRTTHTNGSPPRRKKERKKVRFVADIDDYSTDENEIVNQTGTSDDDALAQEGSVMATTTDVATTDDDGRSGYGELNLRKMDFSNGRTTTTTDSSLLYRMKVA